MEERKESKNKTVRTRVLVEEKIKRLVEEIRSYLKKRSIGMNHKKISALVVSLGNQKRVSDVLIMNRSLACSLFRLLRKYLDNRLINLEADLSILEIKRFIPSLIVRLIFNAYEIGSAKIFSPAKTYGLTQKYILGGIKKLFLARKYLSELKIIEESTHREIKQILRLHRILDEVSRSLSRQYIRKLFRPLFSKRHVSDDTKTKLAVFRLSRKEATFNIVASLKIVSDSPEVLVEEDE